MASLIQDDAQIIYKRVRSLLREKKILLGMGSRQEPITDDEIGQAMYTIIHKIWRQCMRKNRINPDQIDYFSSDKNSKEEYASALHRVLIEAVKRTGLNWNQILSYNNLWWKIPNNTLNLFTPLYKRSIDSKDEPYDQLYVELNQHVIVINSQNHKFTTNRIFDTTSYTEVDNVLALCHESECMHIHRPYLSFLCTDQQAQKIMAINDGHLGAIRMSCNNFQWEINKLAETTIEPDRFITITHLICDRYKLYQKCTTVFDSEVLTDCKETEREIVVLINDCRFVKDHKKIGLTNVTVFYQHWHFLYHADPTEYLMRTVLETLQ